MKSLKEYTEPELKVKSIDWSDIIVTSGGGDPEEEGDQGNGEYVAPGGRP